MTDRSWEEARRPLLEAERNALFGHIGWPTTDDNGHLVIRCRCRDFEGDPLSWAAHLDGVMKRAIEPAGQGGI